MVLKGNRSVFMAYPITDFPVWLSVASAQIDGDITVTRHKGIVCFVATNTLFVNEFACYKCLAYDIEPGTKLSPIDIDFITSLCVRDFFVDV